MKCILHVIEGVDNRLGGFPTLLASITSMERVLNIKNEILATECPPEYINKDLEPKLNLFPASFPKRLKNSQAGIEWLRANIQNYDLIVIHSTWNMLCQRAAAEARAYNVPYIIWPHNSLDPFDLEKKKILKKILGKTYLQPFLKGAKAICSASKLESERLNLYDVEISRVVLPYPVRYSSLNGSRNEFRKKYDLKDNQFVFLFLSRVDYKKGLDLALQAFSKIITTYPQSQFIIAGPDTKGYSLYIKKLINELSISNNVKMIGLVTGSDKSNCFKGADCFVLTSLNESFGIAVVEALQSGTPVLISDNVYIAADIKNLDGGWVCKSEIQDIATHMENILSNKEDYDNKKTNSTKNGMFFSDLERLKGIYMNFYKEMKILNN
jgi:glycosyltransferase involved in cell wall biosynthesis